MTPARQALRAGLGRLGLVLALLAGCGGEGRAPDAGSAPAPAAPRSVLFVGLDGADWQLLDELMASGRMPTLAALAREGRTGILTTQAPPLSPLVWTSMMTGVDPLTHGILDFTRFAPGSGEREPITSDERRVPAVWTVASAAGRRVGVFGLWATYPAEAVDGLVVSDRLFAFHHAGAAPAAGVVHPPSREAWARAGLAAAERAVAEEQLPALLPAMPREEIARRLAAGASLTEPVAALARILIETEVYHRLSTEWIAAERPALAIVYFQGTDAVGHLFAPFAPPRLPAVDAADFARYGRVAEDYFADLDRRLADYRRLAAARGAVLMLASDHGFFWRQGRPTQVASAAAATAARWHRDEGIYLLWGSGIAPAGAGVGRPRGGVLQVAPTLLALLGLPPDTGWPEPLSGVTSAAGPALDYAQILSRPPPPQPAPGAGAGTAGPPSSATPAGAGPLATAAAPAPRADHAEALAQLRALGYLGGAEPARGGGDGSTRTAGSHNNEGLLRAARGELAPAVQAFEAALALDPRLASAAWNLSDLLDRERREPARSDALLLRAWADGLPDGEERVGARVQRLRQEGAAERASTLLDAALAARSDAAGLALLRARLRLAGEDCAGAARDLAAALAARPEDALAHGLAGLAAVCRGDERAARRHFARALALDPDQPEIRAALARLGG